MLNKVQFSNSSSLSQKNKPAFGMLLVRTDEVAKAKVIVGDAIKLSGIYALRDAINDRTLSYIHAKQEKNLVKKLMEAGITVKHLTQRHLKRFKEEQLAQWGF